MLFTCRSCSPSSNEGEIMLEWSLNGENDQRTDPAKSWNSFGTCLTLLNYSLSCLGKLTLQEEINEGAGGKMLKDVWAKCPGVTELTGNGAVIPPWSASSCQVQAFCKGGSGCFGWVHRVTLVMFVGPDQLSLGCETFPLRGGIAKSWQWPAGHS